MKHKEYRNMTATEMSGYRYKPTPAIRIYGRVHTLRQAVRGIKRHDCWQMNGRKW